MRKFLCLVWGTILAIVLTSADIYSFSNHSNTAIASLPTLTDYSIPPNATDNAIDKWLSSHYAAVNQTVPAKHKLFIGKKLSATASTEIGVLKDYEYPENGCVLLGIGVREELISDREHRP